MKLITAIVKPEKLDDLIQTVIAAGAHGLTVAQVRGFGRQYGQLTAARAAAGSSKALLPKIRLDIVVHAEHAEAVVEAITKCANTETIGDGKVWVSAVDAVLRVRTGERDHDAV